MGHQAGDAPNCIQNTIIGSDSGDVLSNNIIIGYNAAASAANIQNEITLGNSAF